MKIEMIRGTTCKYYINLLDESGELYRLKDGEVLRFGIKDRMKMDTILLTKEMTAEHFDEYKNGYMLHIEPEDTESLDLRRRYCYDIGLQSGNDYYNVTPCSDFVLVPNVTGREV